MRVLPSPIFSPGEQTYPAEVTRSTADEFRNGLLNSEQAAACARMKQFTDLNDLLMNSSLGQKGLEQQIRPFVQSMIET